jgi:hypothetical protein
MIDVVFSAKDWGLSPKEATYVNEIKKFVTVVY